MRIVPSTIVMGVLMAGCGATIPAPTQRVADPESAERSPREVGANSQPQALSDPAVAQMHTNTAASGQRTSSEMGLASRQLASPDQALGTKHEGERLAAQASADLVKLGAVKNETQGMVLTLSGSELFITDESILLASAQAKLNEIADILINQHPSSRIAVEGYTDSQGTEAHNQELSQRRARGVRDYLVSRGVAPDRITFEGFGFVRPVADNASAEGRARNHRVEIVVSPN